MAIFVFENKKKIYFIGVKRVRKNLSKVFYEIEDYSGRVCSKIFLITLFSTWCPKSAVRGCKLNLLRKKFNVLYATKRLEKF